MTGHGRVRPRSLNCAIDCPGSFGPIRVGFRRKSANSGFAVDLDL